VTTPSTLAALAFAYAAVQLLGMARYGVEPWTSNADPFAVYFGLFATLAPLHWHDRALHVRLPPAGAPRLREAPGTVALLCTMIGTTSFDGFSQRNLWTGPNGAAAELQQRFVNLGFNGQTAQELAFSAGLLAMVGLISALSGSGSPACTPSAAATARPSSPAPSRRR
jgi:hypothetical protein